MTNPTQHEPRRYRVHHVTEYNYSDDVTSSYSRGALRPRNTATQRIESHEIVVDPVPDVLDEHLDIFGNYSHYVEVLTPHTRLSVTKNSVMSVSWPLINLDALDRWQVCEAAADIAGDPAVDASARALFTLPSDLVQLSQDVVDLARDLVRPTDGLGSAIARVTKTIYEDFVYAKGATGVRTTLPEVLASRSGVCQDFAHLAVACFRTAGLPARYVSGYIESRPPASEPMLTGSDASHAWASVMVPGGGWVDMDPTNNHLVDSRYIVTAWDRDFRDVSPLKGVIFTDSSTSSLKVGVDVIRLANRAQPGDAQAGTE